jgi:predicted small secreted protein
MKTFAPLVATFALTALALTGCAAATGSGGTVPTGSSDTSNSSAPSGGQAGAVNVCAAMPAAAASTAAGVAFTSTKEDDSIKGVFECDYATSGYSWSIAVYQAPNTENLNSLLLDLGGSSNSKSVTGIGDKAYVSPVAVAAQFGSRLIEVGSANNSASNESGYESLAKAAIAAIK